jgi:hypothetical protein
LVVGVIRGRGAGCGGTRGVSRGSPVLLRNWCRVSALALIAGHDGSRRAGKERQGGGSERRAYSLALDTVRETEELLRGVSRRVVGAGGASVAGQVKLCGCATCCQALAAANPQRDHVNNYVKRLVLKHEPRSLAPLRAFEWRKLKD